MKTDSIFVDAVGLDLETGEAMDLAQTMDAAASAVNARVPTKAQSSCGPMSKFAQWALLDESTRAPCGAGCLRPCGVDAERFAELPTRLAPNSSVEVTLFVSMSWTCYLPAERLSIISKTKFRCAWRCLWTPLWLGRRKSKTCRQSSCCSAHRTWSPEANAKKNKHRLRRTPRCHLYRLTLSTDSTPKSCSFINSMPCLRFVSIKMSICTYRLICTGIIF